VTSAAKEIEFAAPEPYFAQVKGRWGQPLVLSLAVWLTVRIVLYSEAIVVNLIDSKSGAFFAQSDWFFRLFHHWDALYYTALASGGYFGPEAYSPWQSFFPGYPLAIRVVATPLFGLEPTHDQLVVSAVLVANVASLLAGAILFRIVADRFTSRIALGALVLFFVGPYSHFLVAPYTEPLFLVFALAAWLSGSRERWLAAGIFAALASFTRANGIFLIAALMVLFAITRHKAGRPWLTRAIAIGAIGAVGVGSYFIYLFVMTGDPLAWSHAQQAGWNRATQWPWRTLIATLREIAASGSPNMYRIQYAFDLLFAVVLVAVVIVFIVKRWWAEAVLVFLTAVSLMTSSNYVSLARNTLTLFPIVILVASFLGEPRRRWIFWVVLIAGIGLLLFNTRQFTLGLWSD